jgi:hypothetical protein
MSRTRSPGSSHPVTKAAVAIAGLATVALGVLPEVRVRLVGTTESACLLANVAGVRCPVCGMTTGVTELFRGNLDAMWSAHPFALVYVVSLAIVTAMVFSTRVADQVKAIPRLRGVAFASLAAFAVFALGRGVADATGWSAFVPS